MSWLQLELETSREAAESLTELLEQLGAVSVSLAAASNEPLFDNFGEDRRLWAKVRLTALLHPDTDLDIMLVCMRDRVGAKAISSHRIETVEDKDWVGEFQSSHQPTLFANSIWVVPSWSTAPETDKPAIILDPGLAFGTGNHPTTALCINWLAEHDIQNKTVIDYGCGSGILAMVAARLGAKQVYAVDIDPQAVQAATANINNNCLSKKIQVGLVDELQLPVVDVLVANILMNPLSELLNTFSKLTRPGSHLLLSGLLYSQAEECLANYAACFTMDPPEYDSEWSRLHGIRY